METGAIPEKYSKNVVTDLPRMVEVVGHYHPAPCWLTADMFPGVNVRVAGQEATNMVGKPHAAPHVHNVPEIYLAPSEKKGDLVVEVQMDDDKFRVEAPFSIFIPSGVRHCFTVLKCASPHFIMGVVPLDWQDPARGE